MTGRGGKLQQLHCYHPFSDSLDIYLTKNHNENYSPKMVPIAKIWGPGSWTIMEVTIAYATDWPHAKVTSAWFMLSMAGRHTWVTFAHDDIVQWLGCQLTTEVDSCWKHGPYSICHQRAPSSPSLVMDWILAAQVSDLGADASLPGFCMYTAM